MKLSGSCSEGAALRAAVATAPTPEEAARIGRLAERSRPDLIRADWDTAKLAVMRLALLAKYSGHSDAREMLLGGQGMVSEDMSAPPVLVEDSPNDYFWGRGHTRFGRNQLGRMLMEVRGEVAALGGDLRGI